MASGTTESPEGQSRSLQELDAALVACRAEKQEAERKAQRYIAAAEEMETLAYAVAHDLKSPLRSMLSFTQLLTRRLPDDPDIREYAGHIISGASEMQAVIDAVQKLANSARPKKATNRTAIRLDVILQLALLGLQSKLKACGAEVHFESLPEVAVDESQFKELFENLIGNSILYRGPEPPRIEIRAEETEDGHTISVQDNGVGIEKPYQEKVFRPFLRLHNKDYPGVGLGLTISRKIVETHGGRMWVESDGQSGSTFRFTLPTD
jgi:light-regulated signal transduction histidine kinase (bacteriophytochrome)